MTAESRSATLIERRYSGSCHFERSREISYWSGSV